MRCDPDLGCAQRVLADSRGDGAVAAVSRSAGIMNGELTRQSRAHVSAEGKPKRGAYHEVGSPLIHAEINMRSHGAVLAQGFKQRPADE
jgi:hypothetical protein